RRHPDASRPGGSTRHRAAAAIGRNARPCRRAGGTDRPRLHVGAEHDLGTVSHAVVGLPGAVDYGAGRLLWAPRPPERWPDLLSRDELLAGLGLPTHIANDADLAAVGEA